MKLSKLLLIAAFFLSNAYPVSLLKAYSGSSLHKGIALFFLCSTLSVGYNASKIVYNKFFRSFSDEDKKNIDNMQNVRKRYELADKVWQAFPSYVERNLLSPKFNQFNLPTESVNVVLENDTIKSKPGLLALSENDLNALGLKGDSYLKYEDLHGVLHNLLFKEDSSFFLKNDCIVNAFKKINYGKVNYDFVKEKWKESCIVHNLNLSSSRDYFGLHLCNQYQEGPLRSAKAMLSILQFARNEAEAEYKEILEAYDQQNKKFSYRKYAEKFLYPLAYLTIISSMFAVLKVPTVSYPFLTT